MPERLRVPGSRDLRATLDAPEGGADGAVVACPPHPRMGGSRSDRRLRAVGGALSEAGVACLRFDYGPWDGGRAERRDVRNALAYAGDRFDAVALFGYSFGAGVALLAAAESDARPRAVSVLAPPATVGDADVVAALDDIGRPLQVVYGERDEAVDWGPVVERARERGVDVRALAADHRFAGQVDAITDAVVPFLTDAVR